MVVVLHSEEVGFTKKEDRSSRKNTGAKKEFLIRLIPPIEIGGTILSPVPQE
jgi:hypothetical protein